LVGPPTAELFAVSQHPTHAPLPRAQLVADKVFSALERFLHVEAVSGVVLLVAAASALIWANSPAADSYHHFWDAPLSIGLGNLSFTRSLHFLINDALMTVFFLVVGMEIRREMHEGALSSVRLAMLPLAAAIGGVLVPAMLYVSLNGEPPLQDGWAVPTATDIAFAVGVLALLGKSIPASIRIFLLALAIIDDIAAVIIIAIFYSGGLDVTGIIIAGGGILLVLLFQRIGIGAAYAYVIPGAIIWFGLLRAGAHPTLAGVVLGLMTPVAPVRHRERPIDLAVRSLQEVDRKSGVEEQDARTLLEPVKQLRAAQRELIPPVVRVQNALHPWVAYGVMPLFALANAGVELGVGVNFDTPAVQSVLLGVLIALVCGKPIGIILGSWIAVRLGWCQLPEGMGWRGVTLVGFLGGIGFTMSIFIATLAFGDENLLSAAKSGVLLASAIAAIVGLVFGRMYVAERYRPQDTADRIA
jgi:Na+:H+ antiporter, NhaA family